jgi:hypothetical protein
MIEEKQNNLTEKDLQDEYGKLDCSGNVYFLKNFELEGGVELKNVEVLNSAKILIIIFCS